MLVVAVVVVVVVVVVVIVIIIIIVIVILACPDAGCESGQTSGSCRNVIICDYTMGSRINPMFPRTVLIVSQYW